MGVSLKFSLGAILMSLLFLQIFAYDHGCKSDADCGNGGSCFNDECRCPKDHVAVHNAKPMCQQLRHLRDTCEYDEQCQHGTAGALSRCHKKKCECYDTEKDDRDKVWDYSGTCYRATELGGKCYSQEQCKASIEPKDKVRCEMEHEGANKGTCKCMDGAKCEERSGGASAMVGAGATLALLLVTAVKVIVV